MRQITKYTLILNKINEPLVQPGSPCNLFETKFLMEAHQTFLFSHPLKILKLEISINSFV